MSDIGIKDTTAYKITRQIMDHVYGSDEKLSNKEFLAVYELFNQRGGSWDALMDDSMDDIVKLEECLESFVKYRNTVKTASKIV